jgi:SAM-dependent methyltransferase
MHPSAMKNCQEFYGAYHDKMIDINDEYQIIEIGSQNVNGSLRGIFPPGLLYTGVDFVEGEGVDVLLEDPYVLPFADNTADMIVCSSVFEHSELFWVLFLEIMRVLKPHGLFYLNVPSNGDVHKWPVDCWRFYPDSGKALVTWAKRNGMNPALLESYTSAQGRDIWNDFVGVFAKDESFVDKFPTRILDTKEDFWNGYKHGATEVLKAASISQDQKKLEVIKKILNDEIKVG